MKQLMGKVFCIFTVFLLISMPEAIEAAKPRVRKPATRSSAPAAKGIAYSSARLSRGTNSVVVTFKNLESVERVDYILNYIGNGVDQGVGGSIRPSGQSTESRDLYFGTCSHGVCSVHRNIRNAQVIVTTTLKNGARNVKRYKIKV